MTKFAYFIRSLAGQLSKDRFKCPSCGNSALSPVIDRKYLITQLRRCRRCKMMFRTPTDDPSKNLAFYEERYTQGFTTDLPSDAKLAEMKRTNFAYTEKCYSYYIDILTKLGLKPSSRVFDYGCSWGYGSFQLAQAGFEVVSFEVSPSRRRYAHEKLEVRTVDDMRRAANVFSEHFDCFFSAHVIEHVPSPAVSFGYAMRLLKNGGLFVSFTPNGSDAHRTHSHLWNKLWGEVHPNFIDEVFLDSSFARSPRAVGSSPVSNVSFPTRNELKLLNNLDGGELFFAAKKIGDAWQ